MQITIFSVCMTVLWSSILILLFNILRTKSLLLDVCSISGVIVIYLFCFIRMLFPVEFSWTKEIGNAEFYNRLHGVFYFRIHDIPELYVYQILIIIWLTGTFILLANIFIQYIRITSYFEALSSSYDEAIDEVQQIFKKKQITIIKTPIIHTPCCIGIFKKKIIIPDKQYSKKQLHYIILHECAHLKNNDFMIKLLINVMCALYWWNPFVYLLKKDLNQSMEIRCDVLVTEELNNEQKGEYLEVMLNEFKELRSFKFEENRKIIVNLLDTQSENLLERFKIIVSEKKYIFLKGTAIAWIIMVCILVISYLFVFQSEYEVPKSEMEMGQEVYEVNDDNTYIVKKSDKTYVLHTRNGDIAISKETVEKLVKDGFKVREEN